MNFAPYYVVYRVFTLLYVLTFSFGVFNAQAIASSSGARVFPSFCEDVTDTAQILGCKKRELEYLQEELKSVYDLLLSNMNADEAQALTNVQSNWLAYRDAECAWEESWSQGEATARVDELACLVSLTKKRLERLDYYSDDEIRNMPLEHAIFPRWQNVLMEQGPHYFWNFNASQALDEPCPSLNGHITPGLLSVTVGEDGKVEPSQPVIEGRFIEAMIGVTVTETTGRPSLDVISLPAMADQCMSAFTLSRNDIEDQDVGEDVAADNIKGVGSDDEGGMIVASEENAMSCAFTINFANAACPSIHISQQDEVFVVVQDIGQSVSSSETNKNEMNNK